MLLPTNLQHSIEELLKETDFKKLKNCSRRITSLYQEGESLHQKETLITYLTVRLPATYAAISSVLSQIPFPVSSLLDLGAGPGTGWWAASSKWENLKATCIEKESFFIDLGRKLGAKGFVLGDLESIPSYKPHDIALFGYSYGELNAFDLKSVWEAVKGVVIVEPGTPRGFRNILKAREQLVALGGHVLAPCPHSKPCPHPKWCHFSVRIERSFFHRLAKEATLPFEDEKYSYVIVTKEPLNAGIPRLIASPEKHSGHVNLSLCTLEGIQKKTLSKRDKLLYKRARKAKWGDYFL